ncbi:uncharacterized protein LOC144918650 [Branchiostoma floridae x Branchiostoma belcheri]
MTSIQWLEKKRWGKHHQSIQSRETGGRYEEFSWTLDWHKHPPRDKTRSPSWPGNSILMSTASCRCLRDGILVASSFAGSEEIGQKRMLLTKGVSWPLNEGQCSRLISNKIESDKAYYIHTDCLYNFVLFKF